MKFKVLRPDGSSYTSQHLERAFEAYTKERKVFQEHQLEEKINMEKSLNSLSNVLKKRYKKAKDYDDVNEWDFYNLDKFQKSLKKILEKKQEQELKEFSKHLKEMYQHYFNPILDGKWKLETPDKVLKEAIKQEKKDIAKQKHLRKQELKKERKNKKYVQEVTTGYQPRRTTDMF